MGPPGARINDPGLLSPAQVSLLADRYELTMAASYLRRDMNQPAVFELFARHLPHHRDWLVVAGTGPALALVERLRFEAPELAYLRGIGFDETLLEYLARFRFTGDVEAMPEGTIAFAGEPLLRVTAPRIEAQIVETLLLNQINFQTAIATKAARLVLAAGAGEIVDFSPRRDHGTDAAMKAARSAAIAGATGTSNLAAAMRYGLAAVGTMAHSYVLSFADELQAFEAFLEDMPGNGVLLVDTFDTRAGIRHAIDAARRTGVPLKGVRLDSGDLLELSFAARDALDEAGLQAARIVASGDLDERRIADLVAAGAPVDIWGVGTELGTSRDSPTVGGVYKLVADRAADGSLRNVAKRSPDKATLPGPKQVFRQCGRGVMVQDVIATSGEWLPGRALLVPAMRAGALVLDEPLRALQARAAGELAALPASLRELDGRSASTYRVRLSPTLRSLTAKAQGIGDPRGLAALAGDVSQHGPT